MMEYFAAGVLRQTLFTKFTNLLNFLHLVSLLCFHRIACQELKLQK